MKKIVVTLLAILLVVGVAFGVYSYIVANQVIEVDDALPAEFDVGPMFDEEMAEMSTEEKDQFMEEMELALEEEGEEMEEKLPEEMEMMMDVSSQRPQILRSSFEPFAHEVVGEALLIQSEGGDLLRFEDFETINGPNLHIYLSADLEATDYLDLGPIKGTKGNINYDLPENIDYERYNKVLVWCQPFAVLFSYAQF